MAKLPRGSLIMKYIYKSFAVLSLIMLFFIQESYAEQSKNLSWQEAKGIAIAFELSPRSVTIYIRNTTDVDKEIMDQRTIHLFYLNDQNQQVFLGNHYNPDLNDINFKNTGSIHLRPHSEIPLKVAIDITSAEFAQVEKHLVGCELTILESDTKLPIDIKTQPIHLSEYKSK